MKRIFALLLTLCLVFSMVPTNMAFAVGTETEENTQTQLAAVTHPNAAYGKAGHGDASVTWTAISTATDVAAMANGGHFYLAGDVTATATVALNNVDVTLCLGGNALEANGTIERLFEMTNGASLTICDCTASGTGDNYTAGTVKPGKKTAGVARLDAKRATTAKTVTLTILDGIFDGANTATGDYCGMIRLYRSAEGAATSAAKLDIQGGKFMNRRGGRAGVILVSANTNGVATIANAQFINCGSWQCEGGAIAVETGSVTINNCVFKNNKAENDQTVNTFATLGSANGGAIWAKNCSLTVQNSVFEGNVAKKYGGAIYAESCSTLSIQNNQFKNNAATEQGGAIYAKSCSNMSVQGGKIEGNSAKHAGAIFCQGAVGTIKDVAITGNQSTATGASAIHIESSSNITLDGCSITGNTHTVAPGTDGYTGAVNLRAESSQLTLKGETVIDNNTELDGTECNVSLAYAYNSSKPANTTVKVDGLSGNANVGIYTPKDVREDANNLLVLGANQTNWDNSWVAYDNKTANVALTGTSFSYVAPVHKHYNGACVLSGEQCDHTGETAVTYLPWESATTLPTSGNYYLTQNVKLTEATTYKLASNTTLNLCLNGFSIDLQVGTGTTSGQYNLDPSATLNLINCQAKLDEKGLWVCGDKNNTTNATAGQITGGQKQYGSAVYVNTGSTVNVYGVNFYNNGRDSGTKSCGAIYLNVPSSVANVANSRFDSNKGAVGAIATYTGGEVTLHDTVLTKNAGGTGGAIYFRSRSADGESYVRFTGDSQIIENTATGSGSAIYVTVGASGDGTATLNSYKAVNVILQDNVVVENNTSGTSSKGAIAIDAGFGAANSVLKVSDNVQIKNNVGNATYPDVFFASRATLKVGQPDAQMNVPVYTSEAKTDPNAFIVADGALTNSANIGVTYVNNGKTVGYENNAFYFVMPPAAHTHADVQGEWIAWGDDEAEKTSLPTQNGNYYLVANVTASASYTSDKTKEGVTTYTQADNISICLNHFNITGNGSNPIFKMSHGANITVCDCTATGNVADGTYSAGKLIPSACSGGVAYLWQKTDTYPHATFTMTGGIIDGNGVTSTGNGAALWAGAKETTIDLKNCVVQNCTNANTVNKDNNNNYVANGGGAVYVSSNPTFTAENVRFYNNKCTGATGYNGGGVIRFGKDSNANAFTEAIFKNCVFDSNSSSARGSVFYLVNKNANKLQVIDCTFTNNQAGDAVIMSAKGSMELTRCTFQNNISNVTAGGGIAVNHEGSSTVILDSCTITGNTAPNSASADMGATYTSGTSTMIVKGNTVVDNNTKKNDAEANMYICDGGASGAADRGYLNVNGLTNGANISVGTPSLREATALIRVATGGTQTSWDNDWVRYENNGLQVAYENGVFSFVQIITHTHADDAQGVVWQAWTDSSKLPTASGYYYLTGPVTTARNTIELGADIHLCLNGQTVTGSADRIYSYYHAGTTDTARTSLSICDCSAVAERGKLIPGNGEGGVFYASAGTTDAPDGIDLYLKNVTIDGAGVTKNSNGAALWAGAAVVVMDLEDCLIQNCSTGKADGGGALYISGGSTLRADNVVFKNNKSTSTSGRGGAIYINAQKPNVTINRCTFENNTSGLNGGAILIVSANAVNITDSTFTGNKATTSGGAIYAGSGNANITIHNTTITNNEAKYCGGLYLRSLSTLAPLNVAVTGTTTITGNNSTVGSGAAIYACVSDTAENANVNKFKAVNLTLSGDITITGNSGAGANGAVAFDCSFGAEVSYLTLEGNVVIKDNITTKTRPELTYGNKCKIKVGQMGPNAEVYVNKASIPGDPDEFLLVKDGATLQDTAATGIHFANGNESYSIGYSQDPNTKFYFSSSVAHASHAACACAITGDTSCQHSDSLVWSAWVFGNSLPTTSGNYYLTKDVVLTNTAALAITGGAKVNLCLNGFSVKFNENWNGGANYYVYAGNELTIMNCQAKLDAKGLLECGNKNEPTNEQAGRLFGGRGLYGGAIYVKGTLNLYGVELYDNQANVTTSSANLNEGIGGAIRVQDGGKITADNCRFENNKARKNGGAIGVVRGNVTIDLNDTVFVNNEAMGVYVKYDSVAKKNLYSITKEEGYAIDESNGRGGALYLIASHDTVAADRYLTEDVVVNITGDCLFQDNYTNNTVGNQGGAIAAVTAANPNDKDLVLNIGDNVQFLNNSSRGVAGAIYMNHNKNTGSIKVNLTDNVKIDGNKSTMGNAGAFYINLGSEAVRGVELNISDNVVISNNSAALGGGAMVVQQNGKTAVAVVNISDKVQFIGNKALKGNGGAIYMQSNTADVESQLNITGEVLFKNNQTNSGSYGGALYVQGCVVNATGTSFLENRSTYGGAIANAMGDATFNLHNITAKDNVAQNDAKSAGNGGFAYVKVYKKASETAAQRTTKDVTMTISGKSVISGNCSYSSGSAIYTSRDETSSGSPEGITVQLILKDETAVTENTALRTSGSAKGAISMDSSVAGKGKYSCLEISGKVVVANNTNKIDAIQANVYLNGDSKLMIGGAEIAANVHVYTPTDYADPDSFVILKEGVALADTKNIGVIYDCAVPAVSVGYSNNKKVLFYFGGEYGAHADHDVCACILTGDDSCKHSDETVWTAWVFSNRLPTTTGNYYLTSDIVVTSNAGGSIGVFEVKDGQKVNLCLNGFSIKFSDKNTTKANYYAMQGSELSIINCKATLDKENHLVSAAGGKITGGRGLYGGALYSKGKLTLIGIELSDNQVIGLHSQNAMANSYGGAVRIQSGGILRATSCLFDNNKALYHGGAIAVGQGDAEVYLHDSVLTNNEAIGVYTKTEKVDGKNKTTVSPTKDDDGFKLDEAKGRGGAIYFNVNHLSSAGNGVTKTPVLEISGNTVIKGNKTNETTGGQGGAIAISDPANNGFNLKVTIKDNVQIVDNCSRATGGAIYVNHGSNAGAPEITIQDNVKISGNQSLAGNGGAIYANLTNKHKTPMKLVITGNAQITGNQTPKGNGGAIFMQHITTGEAAVITLSGNAKISNNKSLYTGAGIQLNGNFELNITENAEISGNISGTYSGGIHATKHSKGENGTTINISGGKIAKNEAMGKLDATTGKMKEGYGGGIYIKQGVINMTGGEISENKANYGGGVFFNTTKFTFTAGKITKNFAKTNGGGISSSQFSEFIMNGKDAIVSYNTTDGPAAGILIQGRKTSSLDGKSITKDYGTTMTMTNGQVYGNHAKKQGGGIFVSTESRAIIKGGSITSNISDETGGGMYESKGEIIVYGGYFANNSVFHAGGAIQASEGKLHIYGGTFENNEAKYGAGFRTYNFTDTVVKNATFINNTAANSGGAIALQSDALIENCTFKGNAVLREEGKTNECDGGALWVWGGDTYNRPSYEVTVTDCLFEENLADTLGGGAAVGHNCTLTITDTTFKNNKSNDRGGAVATVNAKSQRQKIVHLNIDNCEFTNNEAVNDGGAIYETWVSELNLTNSVLTDNIAGRDGGAIYTRKQSDAWIDGCQISGNAAGLRGAAIFVGDNAVLSNINVTDNKSGDTYAVYIDEGGYDGDSYIRAIIKLHGDIVIKDNQGTKQDMFIARKALVNIGYQGLGDNTYFGVELAEGVLTNTLIGEYDYEGGNQKYVVTKGSRSLTDPEPIPVEDAEVEDTTPATEPTATEPGDQKTIGIGGIAGISGALVVAVIAVIAAVAVKKKKKAEESAKETVEE